MTPLERTEITLCPPGTSHGTFAIVTDLHDTEDEELFSSVAAASPDAILVAGDVIHSRNAWRGGMRALCRFAAVAPTFVSVGNHDVYFPGNFDAACRDAGATLLDDRAISFAGFTIGGLTSGYRNGEAQGHFKTTPPPDREFLRAFAARPGYKILLSHHPEYYPRELRPLAIDLIVSGHAHGGQWRIGKQGVFAPGQGIFPRYTSGLYDGRLLVCRGASARGRIPRIANRREWIDLKIEGDNDARRE